jgi:hypothetical protein
MYNVEVLIVADVGTISLGAQMTSAKDSTGVLDYIKGRRGLYGNTGEPPASTRETGFGVTPNGWLKTQVITGKYCRR